MSTENKKLTFDQMCELAKSPARTNTRKTKDSYFGCTEWEFRSYVEKGYITETGWPTGEIGLAQIGRY